MRIKVLTEKGKELATVRIPYERRSFKVTDIQGRTIHNDGTVIQLTAKPSDLTDVKTKDLQINTMVFTLPSVEVGSILEYRLQIRYEDRHGFVADLGYPASSISSTRRTTCLSPQRTSLTSRTRRGDMANNLMYALIAGDGVKVKHDVTGHYNLDVDRCSTHSQRRLDAAPE